MAEEFFRNPTTQEKQSGVIFLDPVSGGKTQQDFIDKYKADVLKAEHEIMTAGRKPFCRVCALLDFQDMLRNAQIERERVIYETDPEKFKIIPPKISDYANPKNFKLITEKTAMERVPTYVSGQTVHHQIKVGVHRDYMCLKRGHGISIFISNDELLAERPKKEKVKKTKKEKAAEKAKEELVIEPSG